MKMMDMPKGGSDASGEDEGDESEAGMTMHLSPEQVMAKQLGDCEDGESVKVSGTGRVTKGDDGGISIDLTNMDVERTSGKAYSSGFNAPSGTGKMGM